MPDCPSDCMRKLSINHKTHCEGALWFPLRFLLAHLCLVYAYLCGFDKAIGLFSIEGVCICTGSDIHRAAWRMLTGPGVRSGSAPEPKPSQLSAALRPQKQPGLEKGSAWGARQSEMERMETDCLRKSFPPLSPSRREAVAACISPPRVQGMISDSSQRERVLMRT